jgi:selenocysteine-specific elongation factor
MLRENRQPLSLRDLEKKCLLRPDELAALLEALRAQGRVAALPGGAFAHRAVIEEVAAKMLGALLSFHNANPQRAGPGRDELFSPLGENPEICELAAQSLLDRNQIERPGPVFARIGWTARLPDRDQDLSDQVAGAFQKAGWAGPAAAELAVSLGQPPYRLEKIIHLLAERGILVPLDQRSFIHREALESAKQAALGLFTRKPSFSTMEFRDALAVSRKYAVPLLDYLDKIRFTVRSGHDRTPGVEAKKALGVQRQV